MVLVCVSPDRDSLLRLAIENSLRELCCKGMATQGQHLQQVMSPTPGPEATGAVPSPAFQPGVVNGTNTGAVDPPPSGLEQPVGSAANFDDEYVVRAIDFLSWSATCPSAATAR